MCFRWNTMFKNKYEMALSIPFGFLQKNIHHNSMFEKYVLHHYENIETNHNLQTSHILCLNETKLKTK
jgi:hypothetical protein